MRDDEYRNFNAETLSSDAEMDLRYLRGKDQLVIKDDDPEFFSFPADGVDNISYMSSSRRILKKFPSRKRKEVH